MKKTRNFSLGEKRVLVDVGFHGFEIYEMVTSSVGLFWTSTSKDMIISLPKGDGVVKKKNFFMFYFI